ncbi:hypothetical protein NE236_32980 [Actinoallomurus purpureus]|uniref:hypothetical protein n=1 Tax=Actinoallomurus purpureus TaxID=478114 RepID=UPI002092026A|nr:hypothetical protein [Actinoallomurus purpureus]MCO6009797.1 hypothetical protein [Actinoallomurus purpureus]
MIELSPGPVPTLVDLRRAQAREALLRSELDRVRKAALAWRSGLGGLLVALVGFGLIKGRSDISGLEEGWAVVVGSLLGGALVTGVWGALAILRAAHGRPRVAEMADLPPLAVLDHREALAAAKALRAGIVLTLGCVGFLVAAVGVTWYGPVAREPALVVRTSVGGTCGTFVRLQGQSIVVRSKSGEVTVPLSSVTQIGGAVRC